MFFSTCKEDGVKRSSARSLGRQETSALGGSRTVFCKLPGALVGCKIRLEGGDQHFFFKQNKTEEKIPECAVCVVKVSIAMHTIVFYLYYACVSMFILDSCVEHISCYFFLTFFFQL